MSATTKVANSASVIRSRVYSSLRIRSRTPSHALALSVASGLPLLPTASPMGSFSIALLRIARRWALCASAPPMPCARRPRTPPKMERARL